jgi:uncharacterized protein
MRNWLRVAALAGVFASAGAAVDWNALRPTGCLSDFTGVVDPGSRSQIEAYCAAVEHATGVRMRLVAISSLQGEPVDLVAAALYRAWNPDPVTSGNGVLFLLALGDRRSSLYSGEALRPLLPGGLVTEVLRQMGPALKQNHYGEVFLAAADTIGGAVARAKQVHTGAHLTRHYVWRPSDDIPWLMLAGAAVLAAVLLFAGAPRGFSGGGGRGLIPALIGRRVTRDSWGSRGSGGFGACDSADSFGGFGGAEPGSRRGGGDW